MVHCRWAIIPDDLFSSNEVLSYLCILIVNCCGLPTIFYFKKGLHTTWKRKEEVEKTRENEAHFVFSFPAFNSCFLPRTALIPLIDMQIVNEKEDE